ncbi:MAG: L-serine ammonia-lyase, iron-sulfur-dependent, subunit alpha, partial [Terrimicrobiaceae bacterium]
MNFDYATTTELLALCEQENLSIACVALRRESAEQGVPESDLVARMRDHYISMRDSVRKGLEITALSPSGLSGGDANKLLAYSRSESPLFGSRLARTMAYGFAVLECNAQFGRIVATPT